MAPPALDKKPEVQEWMLEFIQAFDVLSSRRTVGMGANPISMQDILAYLQIYGSSDVDLFVKYIIAMDIEFMQFINKAKK
jgi:hypothetical protein